MANKPPRPCLGYGPRRGACPNLIRGKDHYCPDCLPYAKAETKKYDKERYQNDPARRFWMGPIGRRISKAKLARDPLCERCLRIPIDEPAVLCHHKDNNELNNDPSNHESLCTPCHEEIHKGDRFVGRISH